MTRREIAILLGVMFALGAICGTSAFALWSESRDMVRVMR